MWRTFERRQGIWEPALERAGVVESRLKEGPVEVEFRAGEELRLG